jgi:hypothetical protein
MTISEWTARVAPRGAFAGDAAASGDTSQDHPATARAASSKPLAPEETGTRYAPAPLDRPSPGDEPLRSRFGKRE